MQGGGKFPPQGKTRKTMKAIALVGTMLAMLIALYLSITSLKAKQRVPALESGAGDSLPATMTQLPAEVKGKLNEAVERGEAQRKAVEDLEK